METELLTPGEAAGMLIISPSHLRDLTERGHIQLYSKTPKGHRRYERVYILKLQQHLRDGLPISQAVDAPQLQVQVPHLRVNMPPAFGEFDTTVRPGVKFVARDHPDLFPDHSFAMFSDEGNRAVRDMCYKILVLATCVDVRKAHIESAIRLGIRQVKIMHSEVFDSAVRDGIHDYFLNIWQLEKDNDAYTYQYADFNDRAKIAPEKTIGAPHDAHHLLMKLDVQRMEFEAAQKMTEMIKVYTKNALRRLDIPDNTLIDCGAIAELKYPEMGLHSRMIWKELLMLIASVDPRFAYNDLRAKALDMQGVCCPNWRERLAQQPV